MALRCILFVFALVANASASDVSSDGTCSNVEGVEVSMLQTSLEMRKGSPDPPTQAALPDAKEVAAASSPGGVQQARARRPSYHPFSDAIPDSMRTPSYSSSSPSVWLFNERCKPNFDMMYSPLTWTLKEAFEMDGCDVQVACLNSTYTPTMQKDIAENSRSGSASIVIGIYDGSNDSQRDKLYPKLTQLGAHVILYNSEPLFGCEHVIAKVHVTNASEVWDYSLANVNLCSSRAPFPWRYMPPGYTHHLDYGVDVDSPLQDKSMIGFIGNSTRVDRRQVMRQYHAVLGKKLVARSDVWNKKNQTDFLTRTPVQLNVHSWSKTGPDMQSLHHRGFSYFDIPAPLPMEAFRMALLLANKACVVSAPVHPRDTWRWRDIVIFANVSNIVNTLDALNVRECRLTAYNTFKERFSPSRLLKESGFNVHNIGKEAGSDFAIAIKRFKQLGSNGRLAGATLLLFLAGLATAKIFRPQSRAVNIIGLCIIYVVVSISMIETNKWLIDPARYPFPVPLMAGHMFVSWFLANCLSLWCPSFFPALQTLEVTWWFRAKLLFIGALFSMSIICCNWAYLYLSLPFLQIMKQGNMGIVYALSLVFGLDALRRCNVMLLTLIIAGSILTIHGELHFQIIGFLLQMGGSFAESSKIVSQGILMAGSSKLDPMTLVLYLSPACLLVGVVPFIVLDHAHLAEILQQMSMHYPVLLINAVLAFCLNVCVAICIKHLSPVGFVVLGTFKDVLIVVTSGMVLGEYLTNLQYLGCVVSTTGALTYSLYKVHKDLFVEDELIKGFSRVLTDMRGTEKESVPAGPEAATC